MSTELELLDASAAIDSASQALFVSLSERPVVACVRAARAKGVSLEMKTARHGKPIRDAVAVLVEGTVTSPDETMFRDVFSPRWSFTSSDLVEARLTTRIAWNLVGTWLLKHATADCDGPTSLADAEDWFHGHLRAGVRPFCPMFSAKAVWQAEQLLKEAGRDEEVWHLLPHIFEEHGQGSRASVMRDPSTAPARSAKRRGGVFYTPSDVANYMVREALSCDAAVSRARCLDPACGTGVFLLALLRLARATEGPSFDAFEYATRCLHGMDISGQALDACAFLLLRECWSDARRQGFTPWAAWHRLRLNLVQVDALTVSPVTPNVSKVVEFGSVIAALKTGEFVTEVSENAARAGKPGGLFGTVTSPLNMVFPTISTGFDCIIGNPPYAAIREETDLHRLSHEFRSLPEIRTSARPNLFPLFVEMMWKFARLDCSSAALVTPLRLLITLERNLRTAAARCLPREAGGVLHSSIASRTPFSERR